AHAAWSHTGNPVCVAPGAQHDPVTATPYVLWTDERDGVPQIYKRASVAKVLHEEGAGCVEHAVAREDVVHAPLQPGAERGPSRGGVPCRDVLAGHASHLVEGAGHDELRAEARHGRDVVAVRDPARHFAPRRTVPARDAVEAVQGQTVPAHE